MWSEYHRDQSRILVNLAKLTRDPGTKETLMRVAAQHAEMAYRARTRGQTRPEPDTAKQSGDAGVETHSEP